MSLASTAFALALLTALVVVVLVAASAALNISARTRSVVVGIGTGVIGGTGLVAGVAAMTGDRVAASLPSLLPLAGLRFALDPLAGLFVAVTAGVSVAAAIFSIGYGAKGVGAGSRTSHAFLPLFVAAMFVVPAAASVSTLLMCWELMALASLGLVLAEHRQRAAVARAGLWYAVMSHLGFVAIFAGLLFFAAAADADSFAELRAAAHDLDPGIRAAIFGTVLFGFASKAGAVPLHAWLPRAHPEAPSHVSALMSAAMVNLGVYGIIRVGWDLLGGGARWWWLLVLGIGAISALYGILQAAVATDLKRLLAYSTTENLGLILVGIGAAGTFAAAGRDVLAGLAMAAALLHIVNHAAFKTLLFLAAGSVLHATGTRDLDRLGGLRTHMPVTAGLFALGALAASALPPGTAFVSEWLLLQSLVHGLPASGVASAITMPVAVAVVALTAGLAIATFVKAFGVGFLARPRSAAAANAHEAAPSMRLGMALCGAACVVLAVAPAFVLAPLARVAGTVGTGAPASLSADALAIRLTEFAGSLSPLTIAAGLIALVLVSAGSLRLLARRARRPARPWDCGAGPMTARMEYTATSFAEPLQRVFDDVLAPEQDVDVTHVRESAYLVESVEYRRRVPDRIERRLYAPVLTGVEAWGRGARKLANGSVHRYLGYGFTAVTALLVVLAVTR